MNTPTLQTHAEQLAAWTTEHLIQLVNAPRSPLASDNTRAFVLAAQTELDTRLEAESARFERMMAP